MTFRSASDAFAFTSLLPATVAFSLSIVSSLVLATPNALHWAELACLGTFIVYNLDRLRDTARDRLTSPRRTEFVIGHRRALLWAVAITSVVLATLLAVTPPDIIIAHVGIGGLGLLHRRFKRSAALKALYVSLAWTGVCVGIPWLAADRPEQGLWVAVILLPVFGANLITSNLRDGETQILSQRPEWALRGAIACILLGAILALRAPGNLTPLLSIVIAEGIAILGYRQSERYGHIVIDGALLVGASLACIQLRAST